MLVPLKLQKLLKVKHSRFRENFEINLLLLPYSGFVSKLIFLDRLNLVVNFFHLVGNLWLISENFLFDLLVTCEYKFNFRKENNVVHIVL